MEYETVIGLEIHAQLATETKLFCGCAVEFGAPPNSRTCPVCLAWPGSLPSLNRRAVELAVRAALAFDCELEAVSRFDRKQYFYPDLPKGYQISQYEVPYARGGHLEVEADGETSRVELTRIHIEEDAGKSMHDGDITRVDLNRAGTPLIEIVTEPVIRSSAVAAATMRLIRDTLVYFGVNDGNLERGSLRCDANVSVRRRGATELGTRTELKNLNSYRFVQRAIDHEAARQIAVIESGGTVLQETRSYDPQADVTRSMRGKEEAHDYRYFPDPDIPLMSLDDGLLAAAGADLPERPDRARKRLVDTVGLSTQAAWALTQHREVLALHADVSDRTGDARRAANFITTEVLRDAETDEEGRVILGVTADQVAGLLELVASGEITGKQAKEVFAQMRGSERTASSIVDELGLRALRDEGQLREVAEALVREHSAQVEQYRGGKTGLLGFFVGQLMKKTGGRADPKLASELLRALLEHES